MVRETISVRTHDHVEFLDITHKINEIIQKYNISDGLCTVFIPHTTAGVTINENADPDVKRDMIMELDKIVPQNDGYRHMEGNSAAHIKSSMMGFSQTLIIENNQLILGTWQSVYFCEFDGPRHRKVVISIS